MPRETRNRMFNPASPNNKPTKGKFGGKIKSALKRFIGWGKENYLYPSKVIDKITGAYQTDQTNQALKQESELAWEREKEMWGMMNQYNSPEQQMERWSAAGLNPNLMYGQGSSGNTNTYPKYQAAHQDYSGNQPLKLLSVLGTFMDTSMKGAQIDNVKAQNKVINAEADKKTMENWILGNTKQFKIDKESAQSEKMNWEWQKTAREVEILDKTGLQAAQLKNKMSDAAINEKVLDNFYKENRNLMLEFGIQPQDKFLIRFIYKTLAETLENTSYGLGEDVSTYKKLQPLIEEVNKK